MSNMVKEAMGVEYAKDNPFISSETFLDLVKVFAAFPKMIMPACSNSGEAVNAVLSLSVTFLKNIPDHLWELMRKVSKEQGDTNPTEKLFGYMDALRNYDGKNYVAFEGDEGMPFTTKPPTTPV